MNKLSTLTLKTSLLFSVIPSLLIGCGGGSSDSTATPPNPPVTTVLLAMQEELDYVQAKLIH